MSEYKLYYIEWEDAVSSGDTWTTPAKSIEWAEAAEDGLVKHVGWIIKETPKYILLASRLVEVNGVEPDLGAVFKIPSKWVRKKVNISKSINK